MTILVTQMNDTILEEDFLHMLITTCMKINYTSIVLGSIVLRSCMLPLVGLLIVIPMACFGTTVRTVIQLENHSQTIINIFLFELTYIDDYVIFHFTKHFISVCIYRNFHF